jgi:hypothetical protein
MKMTFAGVMTSMSLIDALDKGFIQKDESSDNYFAVYDGIRIERGIEPNTHVLALMHDGKVIMRMDTVVQDELTTTFSPVQGLLPIGNLLKDAK